MTPLFGVLALAAGLFCVPAYLAGRDAGESPWLLASSLPALALWVALASLGFGPQSLSNLVEPLLLLAGAVILAYLKVLLLDPRLRDPRRSTYGLMALLALGAFLLRAFMPLLPE